MRPFKYKPPRVKTGDLRTFITFYEYAPNNGPEPGESEKRFFMKGGQKLLTFG